MGVRFCQVIIGRFLQMIICLNIINVGLCETIFFALFGRDCITISRPSLSVRLFGKNGFGWTTYLAQYVKINNYNGDGCFIKFKGAQWLSGRVLDSRPKGRGFEPHWRHCVVVLEQDTFILA